MRCKRSEGWQHLSLRPRGGTQVVFEDPRELPNRLKEIVDVSAGKVHSENGRVMRSVMDVINWWEQHRDEWISQMR